MAEAPLVEPKLVSKYGMYIVGWEVRTANHDEANQATARIPALWKRVQEENLITRIPEVKDPSILLGIYTRYQRTDKGPYSLIVGTEVESIDSVPAGMVGITVLSQEYLIFSATGQMPGAVISAWTAVWKYFSQATVLRRSFTTDFERYDTAKPDEVDVYIAVR